MFNKEISENITIKVDNLRLQLSNDKQSYQVVGYYDFPTNIIIPTNYNGIDITTINSNAFYNCESLQTIELSDNITSIGDLAFFNCYKLRKINITRNIKEIGKSAFVLCDILLLILDNNKNFIINDNVLLNKSSTRIYTLLSTFNSKIYTIPDSIVSIDPGAFINGNLDNIVVSSKNKAFKTNSDNTILYNKDGSTLIYATNSISDDYTISSIVKNIGKLAFVNNDNINKITIPSTVISIGDFAFYQCLNLININVNSHNKKFSSDLDAIYNKDKTELVLYYNNKNETFSIPSSIKTINSFAFSTIPVNANMQLVITIPDSVTKINKYAIFNNKSIDNYNITLQFEGEPPKYESNIFINLENVQILYNYDFINVWPEYYSDVFTRLNFSHSILSTDINSVCIGDLYLTVDKSNSFYIVTSLNAKPSTTELSIPKQHKGLPVTMIYLTSTVANSEITSIYIPDSIKYLDTMIFTLCTNLQTINIPDSVRYVISTNVPVMNKIVDHPILKSRLFLGCPALKKIVMSNNQPIFSTNDEGTILYNKLKTTLICALSNIDGSVEIPSTVTTIEYHAFSGCSSITNIVIPDSVESIGYGAFKNCFGLKSITIPESVKVISDMVFSGCMNLSKINVDSNNTYYLTDSTNTVLFNYEKTKIIYCCKTISGKYIVPNTVRNIDNSAFSDCRNLLNVEFPLGIKSIGRNAFEKCISLTNIKLPQSIVNIDLATTFKDCINLESINIPDNINIDKYTREDFSLLDYDENNNRFTFYDNDVYSLLNIGNYFIGCIGLKQIIVNKSNSNFTVMNEGTLLLNKEKSILLFCVPTLEGELVVPSTVIAIANNAFKNCSNLTDIVIPKSVKSIGTIANAIDLSTIYKLSSMFQNDNSEQTNNKFMSINERVMNIVTNQVRNTVKQNAKHTIKTIMNSSSKSLLSTLISPFSSVTDFVLSKYKIFSIYNPLVFESCLKLSSIKVDPKNNTFSTNDDNTILFNKFKEQLLFCVPTLKGNVIIPQSVSLIMNCAFNNCADITSINIPPSVNYITPLFPYVLYILQLALANIVNFGNYYISNSISNTANNLIKNTRSVNIKSVVSRIKKINYNNINISEHVFPILNKYNITAKVTSYNNYSTILSSLSSNINNVKINKVIYLILSILNGADYGSIIQHLNLLMKVVGFNVDLYKITGYFVGCTSLKSITVENKSTSFKTKENGTVLFNNDFTSLNLCVSLKSGDYKVPTSVISIESNAFSDCSNLTSIAIPDTVTNISFNAFSNCSNLQNITVSKNNNFYSSDGSAIFNKDKTKLLFYVNGKNNKYTIPSSVTTISSYAFTSCNKPLEVKIPANVAFIEQNAFYNCSNQISLFFLGNPPATLFYENSGIFNNELTVKHKIYYQSSNNNWGKLFYHTETEPRNVKSSDVKSTENYFKELSVNEVNNDDDDNESMFETNTEISQADYNTELTETETVDEISKNIAKNNFIVKMTNNKQRTALINNLLKINKLK